MKIITSKVSIIGDNEAGKSEFIRKISGQPFKGSYVPTIGADFTITEVKAGDQEVHLYLWDLNGSQSFSILRQYYMHGSNVYVVIVDASNPGSFDHADGWKAQGLRIKAGVVGLLVATKIDLVPDRAVAERLAAEAASRLGLKAALVSAKTGEGCVEALREIVRIVDQTVDVTNIEIRERPTALAYVPLVVGKSGEKVSRRIACKVAFIGDCQAGKSTFVRRVRGAPFSDKYQLTFLFDTANKEVIIGDVSVDLYLIDLYGRQELRDARRRLLHGTGIFAVAVDMTNPNGLDGIIAWRDEALQVCPAAKAILVGMKHDAARDGGISDETFFSKAKELGMQAMTLSAKTGEGCDELLAEFARIAIANAPTSKP